MPITLDGTNGITTPTYGGADTSEYLVPVTQFKNRIINGAMVIDQRNAGGAVTGTPAYPVDRWYMYNNTDGTYSAQQDSSAPAGFSKSLKVTVTSADASLGATQYLTLQQNIEGFNTADLGFGTANAQTITLSFWVRSSLTGAFGGSIQNSAQNRCYPFSYTISAANTWEFKSVTIAGDTTGTWVGATNGTGLIVLFGFGIGSTYSGTAGAWTGSSYIFAPTGAVPLISTNGATWQTTGVQLEVGSTATSFDYRPYGTELQLCQRYYIGLQTASSPNVELVIAGAMTGATNWTQFMPYPMRTAPTVNLPTSSVIRQGGGTYNVSSWTSSVFGTNPQGFYLAATVATSLTANSAAHFYSFQQTANFSAEL